MHFIENVFNKFYFAPLMYNVTTENANFLGFTDSTSEYDIRS